MRRVDYDAIASRYHRRYETNRFDGLEACVRDFAGQSTCSALAEVGCGTGHWLRAFAEMRPDCSVAGLDLSMAMLSEARRTAPSALLVRGTADRLPWADDSFDRVLCVNALHHFQNHPAVFAECARVLRPGGAFMTIGLDPHAGADTWWIYEYFPAALVADRRRYPATATIRASLTAAGFHEPTTRVAQHIPAAVPFDEALAKGLVDRSSTSQLMVITDEEFTAGHARLLAERPRLEAELHLYATTARK
jgi:ubiquinone/menaquinone biosynthesis C-methylase UbiE